MIHELDEAIRHYADGRASRLPAMARTAAGPFGHPGGLSIDTVSRSRPGGDGIRLGLGPLARPMQSSTIRVLETTWRLWREPQG